MGRYRFVVAGLLALLVTGPAVAAPTLVTLFFDPADFYDFRPLDEGFSLGGGMFKLHEVWNDTTLPEETLQSWEVLDRPRLDAWAASLEPDDDFVGSEGIGFFNIDLNALGLGRFWGQDMQTPLLLTRAFAPAGWEIRDEDFRPEDNTVGWTALAQENLIRPDTTDYNDGRSFGFQFTTADSIPLGAEETIWFGGFNFFGFAPSLTFSSQWGPDGFRSRIDPVTGYGTGFEATLHLRRDFIEADFDDNGVVDGNDFLIWQDGFGTDSGATHADGDANFDGVVDGNDFLVWQAQFGLMVPDGGGSAAGGAIPEPASVALAGVMLLCVYCSFRPRVGA